VKPIDDLRISSPFSFQRYAQMQYIAKKDWLENAYSHDHYPVDL